MSKHHMLLWTTVFLSVATALVLSWWFFFGRFTDFTDDAYVSGNQVRVTPQIEGIVASVHCDDTELVQEGQVLVTLDPTDRRIAFEKSKTALAQAVRSVTQKFEQVYALAAQYESRQADLIRLEVDYTDRKAVVASGAVSEEDFIRAETNYVMGDAALRKVKYDLMQAISEVQYTTVSTHPMVERAKEEVRHAFVHLKRCVIKAAATGIVAQRKVQVGESVTPLTPLLAIVPFDQMWVDANYREVDLAKIRLGQSVRMTSDTYGGGVVYRGEVLGIGGGSGAVFSPLPPQNATGNWIKIVQRVPVRISIEADQLKRYPLRLGLSMNVKIDVRADGGVRVPKQSIEFAVYRTTIFEEQIEGVEEVIQEVLQKNITFDLALTVELNQLVSQ